jgi:hypothetical protein
MPETSGYEPLYPGIEYSLILRSVPRPLRVHVIRADLKSGSLEVRTPVGPDPDGEGPSEASLADPVALARASNALILVNASAFLVSGYAVETRPLVYLRGMGVGIAGLAVDSGKHISPSDSLYASFYVTQEGRAAFSALGEEPERDGRAKEAAAGFLPLVAKSVLVEDRQENPEARTAVGKDAAGRLIIVVAEGRHRGVSEGLTLRELALFMKEIGCVDALNLDGGGSSVLVVRGTDGRYRALTRATDGLGPFRAHRPIPNALALIPSE